MEYGVWMDRDGHTCHNCELKTMNCVQQLRGGILKDYLSTFGNGPEKPKPAKSPIASKYSNNKEN